MSSAEDTPTGHASVAPTGRPAADSGQGSADTLLDRYDALLLDLDGTVYRGGAAVDGAVEAVAAADAAGVGLRFVTNNASRSPDDVAEQLRGLGLSATSDQVTTSAQAAAGMLADRLDAGAEVLVVGTEALADEVRARGFRPVRAAGPGVRAVVQGLSQDVGWRELTEAAIAVRAGALWIACNVDPTLPAERGLLPGNGALVAAVRAATGAEPRVAGKPARPLMDDAIRAAGGRAPLAVGDRLDTDIAGAVAAGIDALLVLTGVSTPADLLAAPADQRPRYVAADLRGVTRPAAETAVAEHADWSVEVDEDRLHLRHAGERPGAPLVALRALCAAWWAKRGGPVTVVPADDAARSAVEALGLAATR